MREAVPLAWRYPDDEVDQLTDAIARDHGVPADHLLLGPGSNEILRLAAAAFSGPDRKIVIADPTFEAIGGYGRATGAEIAKIPLTADFHHDLPKMLAVNGTGLVYLCNPNNPTASVTPKGQVRDFIAALKGKATVLVDEAYHHFADSPDYESVIPLVEDNPHLLVARTFSKIHGLAGLRCGYAVARPEVIERLWIHRAWDVGNIMALVAARASLGDPAYLEKTRRLNRETRDFVIAETARLGYQTIPSQANFVMIDLRREARPVIDALRQRDVRVGRVFPALPHHLRVSVGTREQMEAFLNAFRQALA
jgi:histidinol-phosphate aminotransferase